MKHSCVALLLVTALASAFAQAPTEGLEEEQQKEEVVLSAPSDATSKSLLSNNTTVIGAKAGLKSIVAYGTFDYGDDPKEFQLMETSDGRRAIRFRWTYMGRPYTETIVSVPRNTAQVDAPDLWRLITKAAPGRNGDASEERVYLKFLRGREVLHEERFGHTAISYKTQLNKKELTYEQRRVISGGYAERSAKHFRTVPLFIHDFFDGEVTGCQFIGKETLAKRETYVIRRGSESFYYMDKEKFLLLQWGRKEVFGAKKLEVSYLANTFKRWNGPSGPVLLPSKISVMAEGQVLGSYSVDRVEIDTELDSRLFTPPSI